MGITIKSLETGQPGAKSLPPRHLLCAPLPERASDCAVPRHKQPGQELSPRGALPSAGCEHLCTQTQDDAWDTWGRWPGKGGMQRG